MSKSKKEVIGYVKLVVPAGKAAPSQQIGPALGQKGLNIMEFCKAFNTATKNIEIGTPIPVVITAFKDKSFTFVTRTPPVSHFLKTYAKVEKGVSATKRDKNVGSITLAQCKEIAVIKMPDLNAYDIDAAVKMIKGSALSMGIEIIEE